ncbi:hypothetical protein GW793_02830 [bacterium]|uniref:Uncharacterized protein n=2 Tax=Katanobacteria TaxID=422282 RepID=A0A2M7X226_UNCKA|nr:hypothetical protein [bacterium]PIP56956.1 MAG: hypothetical protein COX05_00245 [candidate division WWE3 bacterium CG22_combo_CG10-13_8_21_14_all_39_12]PJA40226.1 MAG: hypothetical protein CO179_02855 [candidate division WWE3 bacterium CG_4_9_14_3_um_filter_39_7]
MGIPNRVRLVITAVTYTILISIHVLTGNIDAFIIGIVVVIGTAWSFGFDLKVKEILPFLFLPAIYVMSMPVIIGGLEGLVQYVALVISGAGLYVFLLTLNILNVATIKRIPLKKPALSALYLFGIVLFFFYAYRLVLHEGWGNQTSLLWYWLSVCLYGFSYLYIISSRVFQLESLLFTFISAEIVILVAFFPAMPLNMSIFMVGWIFIILGIMQHNSEKTLTRSITREYVSAGLIISIMYFLL